MEKLERIVKKVNFMIVCVMSCCVFTLGMVFGLQSASSANDFTTEEVLLQKDAIIKQVVQYEEGLNPFFATSKATQLANLSTDKLEKLANSGYIVYVVDTQSNENLPEPVKVEEGKIIVSTYSNDGALVDTVNQLLN